MAASGAQTPENVGGTDLCLRKLNCAVINFLHLARKKPENNPSIPFGSCSPRDSTFTPTPGLRPKTHIQICVRNQENIHGVFRVHERSFSDSQAPATNDG